MTYAQTPGSTSERLSDAPLDASGTDTSDPGRRDTQGRTKEEKERLQRALLMFDLMSKEERELGGHPANALEWAELHGVGRNTVGNWRKDPAYVQAKKEIEGRRKKRVQQELLEAGEVRVVRPQASKDVSEEVSNVDLMAKILRNNLAAAAQGGPGSKEALDWIKSPTISKPLLDALSAQVETVFPDKDVDELIDMILDSAGETVVARCRARGLV